MIFLIAIGNLATAARSVTLPRPAPPPPPKPTPPPPAPTSTPAPVAAPVAAPIAKLPPTPAPAPPTSSPATSSTSQASTVASSAPPPAAAPGSAPAPPTVAPPVPLGTDGKPLLRSTPPDGFTFVDATQNVPGHWERLKPGQVAQGAPLDPSKVPAGTTVTAGVEVRDHTGGNATGLNSPEQIVLATGTPTYVLGNYTPGDAREPVHYPKSFDQLLADHGATPDELDFIRKERNAALGIETGTGGRMNDIDNHLEWLVRDGVGAWYLKDPAFALQIKDQGLSPLQWYADTWYEDAHAAIARDKAQADAAKATPPTAPKLPVTLPTSSTSSSSKLLIGALAILAGAYLLLACRDSSSVHTSKFTLRYPFVSTVDGGLTAAAIPVSVDRSVVEHATGATGGFQVPDPLFNARTDAFIQRISLPDTTGLVYIGIAADSGIAQCDISFGPSSGDTQWFRVNPGNPFLGPIGAFSYINVTVPISPAPITVANFRYAMDAVQIANPAGGSVWGFPLRLEILSGDAGMGYPPRAYKRAVFHGSCRLTMAAGESAEIFACMDGRQQVRVVTSAAAGSLATMSVFEVLPLKQSANGGRVDTNNVISLGGGATPLVNFQDFVWNFNSPAFTNFGNAVPPIGLVKLVINDANGTGAGFHQIDLYAFDDAA